jgi:hypothetical protein
VYDLKFHFVDWQLQQILSSFLNLILTCKKIIKDMSFSDRALPIIASLVGSKFFIHKTKIDNTIVNITK